MSLIGNCPKCGHVFQRPDGLAGKLEKCPKCRHVFRLPALSPREVVPSSSSEGTDPEGKKGRDGVLTSSDPDAQKVAGQAAQVDLKTELAMNSSDLVKPRRQTYYFAYKMLPSCFFGYPEFPRKIRFYPGEFDLWFVYLWTKLTEQLPPELHSSMDGLKLSAHRIGGKLLMLVIRMPPPQQALEVHYIALVISSPLRYFTLGMGMVPGRTTVREVWANGAHGPVGWAIKPDQADFMRYLCKVLNLPESIDDLSKEEVIALAPVIFPELENGDGT